LRRTLSNWRQVGFTPKRKLINRDSHPVPS
jgi:hypothetical protein